MLKFLLTLFIGLVPLSGKPSRAEILSAFSKADSLSYEALVDFNSAFMALFERQELKEKDVSEEFWNTYVEPRLLTASRKLGEATQAMEAAFPRKIDRKDPFWSKAYFEVYRQFETEQIQMSRPNLYHSDYLMMLAGYPNYMYMYLAIIDTAFERVDKARNLLGELISGLK